MIVLIGGEKGGTGKTTLAVNLATARALAGGDVLLVDSDPQGSASLWADIRSSEGHMPIIPCVAKRGKSITAELRGLAERYGDIVVDAGGRDSVELRSALMAARLAVLPIQASLFDGATLQRLSEIVVGARAFNPDLVAGVVLNRASPNRRVSETAEAAELVSMFPDLLLMETVIRDRIVFRRTVKDGLSAYEAKDAFALAELESLYREIYGARMSETIHSAA